MTIVIIGPDDVIGREPTTGEWLLRYGIPAPAVHELEIDTVRLSCKAQIYEYSLDHLAQEIVIKTDEEGKPVTREAYTFPIRDLPPGLERALRENVQSVTMRPRSSA